MPWKILVTAPGMLAVGQAGLDLLVQAGCQITAAPDAKGDACLATLLAGHQAVIAAAESYSASLLRAPEAKDLRIISRWGVGYDAIDVAAATQQGILITNTPGLLSDTVADYTFALLLSSARRIHEAHLDMRQGNWVPAWGADVSGKTLGLIGWGGIAQAVAKRASGFAMETLVNTRNPNPSAQNLAVKFTSLDAVLERSDFVSLHASLTPATHQIIGEAQLRRMKPSAYLINTSRGALVDEAALLEALRQGWIAGAALDVFTQEPLPVNHPLRSAPNILLQPHHASSAREAGARISLTAAQAVLDFMRSKQPQFVVNSPVLGTPERRP